MGMVVIILLSVGAFAAVLLFLSDLLDSWREKRWKAEMLKLQIEFELKEQQRLIEAIARVEGHEKRKRTVESHPRLAGKSTRAKSLGFEFDASQFNPPWMIEYLDEDE